MTDVKHVTRVSVKTKELVRVMFQESLLASVQLVSLGLSVRLTLMTTATAAPVTMVELVLKDLE